MGQAEVDSAEVSGAQAGGALEMVTEVMAGMATKAV